MFLFDYVAQRLQHVQNNLAFCHDDLLFRGRDSKVTLLWTPCAADADIIFLPHGFFFFPRLISAVGDWMSTILPHMVWP